ncbi:triphosphoribosyl-dephospho-CoA synthase [Methanolobus bombayensis]|uniref:triphosphoribosyl-dephospho-CoA synthase n=1 Tax=Methanolobus bombayensis TaxID=38023 RepID=UPI001AE62B90|nr:triphosphoribosyl-dephospho-CoA synthase [Methanolobus bombayensis]MBP1909919.1 triphosphoribosyl-dephospho-CoA synthase [Methanolobus bombayensis]
MIDSLYNVDRGNYPLPAHIARCAQLAMCLEVSSSPKPGNIDRYSDYHDTRYEHFLASASAVYPVIEEAVSCENGVGRLIYNAVSESVRWQKGGNTHFGAFLLLVPFAMAAGEIFQEDETFTIQQLIESAYRIVKNTTTEDSVNFYSCFDAAGVKVNSVDEFDLKSSAAIDELHEKDMSLYKLMDIARGYDIIANEWVTGFKRCALCAELIIDGMNGLEAPKLNADINNVTVYAFMKILSDNEDTFISTKYDTDTAAYVSGKARGIIEEMYKSGEDFNSILPLINKLDQELLEKKINPGSTADITIAGLFISLLAGVRF